MIYDQEYFEFQTARRSRIRQFVRNIFLRKAVSLVRGRTVDMGCGCGELLRCLPAGSIGVEVNKRCVEYLQECGLECRPCEPATDGFNLMMLKSEDKLETLICSHVLEHLQDPAGAVRELAAACTRLGISRMVFIVPDKAGFNSHYAHVTYCDEDIFRNLSIDGFQLKRLQHFPFRTSFFQKHFVGNELQVIYETVR